MDELISKKELLEQTHISYGQLYRWKRKNIIPDNWFIKKSVPSGQETYFPKEKILDRIDAILNLKEEVSLDELAKIFSLDINTNNLNLDKLLKYKILSEDCISLYKKITKKTELIEMIDYLGAKIFNTYVLTNIITIDEGKMLDEYIGKNYHELKEESCKVYLIRNLGVPLIIGSKILNSIVFDDKYKVVLELSLYDELSSITLQMME